MVVLLAVAVLAAAGSQVAYLLTLALAFTGTCTQGGTGAFEVSLVVSPAVALATSVLWWLVYRVADLKSSRVMRIVRFSLYGSAAISVLAALGLVPTLVHSTLQGHHLCGPSFTAYLAERLEGTALHRLWAPTQLAFLALVGMVSLRCGRHAQPESLGAAQK